MQSCNLPTYITYFPFPGYITLLWYLDIQTEIIVQILQKVQIFRVSYL